MLTREQNDAIFGPSIHVFRFIDPEEVLKMPKLQGKAERLTY
jgi:hypothetical protein